MERNGTAEPGDAATALDPDFSLLDILIVLLRQKRRILLHFAVVTVIAVITSYLIPKKYKSTTLFLPPKAETLNLPGLSASFGLNLGGDMEFTPRQIAILLDSRTILDSIIKKYDLVHVYKTSKEPNYFERALKQLRKNIDLSTEEDAGLTQSAVVAYSLSVIDKDKQRSAAMTNDLVDLLNANIERFSKRQEEYTLEFVKGRLDSVQAEKSALEVRLSGFQKEHKIYGPELKDQVDVTISAIAELKRQRLMAEIDRNTLLMDRERGSQEVQVIDRRINELDKKMSQLQSGRKDDILPSLDKSVDLGYTYLDMVKDFEILTKLEIFLRQQYEEARIKNAKRAPLVRVIDRAVPPQWKNSPKKILIVLGVVGAYMFAYLILLLARFGIERAPQPTLRRIREFKAALKP